MVLTELPRVSTYYSPHIVFCALPATDIFFGSQDCAATNTMRYGRASSAGARFARPCTSEQVQCLALEIDHTRD